MAKKVYNPNAAFAGITFVHGKACMQKIEETFDPDNWTFECGESDVIRAGAGVLINDQLCIAHVDFSPGDTVELAVFGGFYKMATAAAIAEFVPAYVAETDDGEDPASTTGLALTSTAGASPAGMNFTVLGVAGTAEFHHRQESIAAA